MAQSSRSSIDLITLPLHLILLPISLMTVMEPGSTWPSKNEALGMNPPSCLPFFLSFLHNLPPSLIQVVTKSDHFFFLSSDSFPFSAAPFPKAPPSGQACIFPVLHSSLWTFSLSLISWPSPWHQRAASKVEISLPLWALLLFFSH